MFSHLYLYYSFLSNSCSLMTSQKWTNLPQFCKEKHCHYFVRKTSTCVEASSGVADPTLFKLRSFLIGWRHNWRITFFKRARRGFLLKFSFQKQKKLEFYNHM